MTITANYATVREGRDYNTTANPKSFNESRTSDKAEAFRVHVSKDHEAFRLMYWARPDGSTEFANIGIKQELLICQGDFKSHFAARYS